MSPPPIATAGAGYENRESSVSGPTQHHPVSPGRVSISILIDEAHRQFDWIERPVADGGYSSAIAAIGGIVDVRANKSERLRNCQKIT